jgi:hypothetical protein
MKYFLTLLCLCVVAQAQSFKVYELLIPKDQLADYATLEAILAAANGGGVMITAYANIPEGENGVWLFDQTYLLRYSEAVDDSGKPISFTDKKVGLYIKISRQDDGRLNFVYNHTKLESWIPFSGHPGVFQPNFSTTEITPGPIHLDGYIVMGGLHTQDGVLNIIFEKIAPE